jgi:hypothetical protein
MMLQALQRILSALSSNQLIAKPQTFFSWTSTFVDNLKRKINGVPTFFTNGFLKGEKCWNSDAHI